MIGEFLKGRAIEFRHLALETCVSTNDTCMEFAKTGEPGNLWVSAESQTASKGSRGRKWVSQKGNLLTSVLLTNPCDMQALSGLTFVAAVSVHEAVAGFFDDGARVQLKWPNDLILNGRKCAGILLESSSQNLQINAVIGIGINCASSPQNTIYPATSMLEEGEKSSAQTVFTELTETFAKNLELWDRGNNFAAIRNKWLQHAIGIGKTITIKLPDKSGDEITKTGIFATVDEEGYMMLELDNGVMTRISTADVFFDNVFNTAD